MSRVPLDHDVTADVCVVGAGMAGLSVGYNLARFGRRVVVIDAADVGSGQTAQTTAHLASALDDRFFELEHVHGTHGARLAYESHARAIDDIEATIARESISCDFARLAGYLFLGPGQKPSLIDQELEAALRAGFLGATKVARVPLASFDTGPSILFPSQGRFHPLRYLEGLAAAIERLGGVVHTRSRVTEVHGGDRPRIVTKDGYEVRAGAIVVATNSPFYLWTAMHTKQAPYRTYAVGLRVPRGSVPDALYWDMCDPYHYVRLQPGPDFDRLIVGGEDHRTAESDDGDRRYRALVEWARERFPVQGDALERWSGQVLEPFDHLAYIGKDPTGTSNVYIATGDSGHGITHGAIAGILIADLIEGRPNPWQSLYDPRRKSLRAASQFARDGIDVAKEYAKWLLPEPRTSALDLGRDEGAVVQRGIRKVAVYRDPEGVLHHCSAVCTHLGGVVRWNSDAKSWDCGCHGSRFSPTGEVLNGPAVAPLATVEALEDEASPRENEDDGRPPRRGRIESALRGGAAGAVATVAMTAVMLAERELGLLGQLPPKKLVRGARRALGIVGTSHRTDNVVTTAAHLGFGVAMGSLYGLANPRRRRPLVGALLGAGFGTAVWAASYAGWIPALGLMPPPRRDRPFRPASMVVAHWVFGAVLGAFLEATTKKRVRSKSAKKGRSEVGPIPAYSPTHEAIR
ncbi:MAG: FAD-dependent oxidoreductase [Polyangiaceae bacterium]